MANRQISVSAPSMTGNERLYVNDCLDKNQLSWRGEYVGRFEEAFAKSAGVTQAVACSSGTAALHLALLALGIGEGDEVFLPALTYIATANAVTYVGAKPVFCDVDESWCIDPIDLRAKLRASRNPRVILQVHLYGAIGDFGALADLANDFGAWLVGDAAEAHGAEYDGQSVGALSDIVAFSFFANKLLATGEGGMLTTGDRDLAERLRLYRGQGQAPGSRFCHPVVGYNYRMTNIQAAIGLAQLETLEQRLRSHAFVMNAYESLLADFRGFEFQRRALSGDVCWLMTILLPRGIDRDETARRMAKCGVETRPAFPCVPGRAPYSTAAGDFRRSLDVARRGLSLPTHAAMTYEDVSAVVAALREAL